MRLYSLSGLRGDDAKHLAPIGKIISGKQNTVKRYTPKSATPIGANTMFMQIG